MDYDDYVESGTISSISLVEKRYISQFLEYTYKDNVKACKDLVNTHPRWSIISGYYAMHDISKLYLLLAFDIEFTKPSVHDAVIKALKKLVPKKDIIQYLENADSEFKKIQRLDYFLAKGKEHREKTQYYTALSYSNKEVSVKAQQFYNSIVKNYISIIEELINEELVKEVE